MSYNNNIPQPTDVISNSQPDLLGNFQAIDSGTTGTGIGFSRNHVTMSDATNGGLHNRVDYYQAVTSPTISGFVGSAYPKTVTNVELFYKNGSKDMQITNSTLTAGSGQGMAPGGLQFRSGSANSSGGSGASNAISPPFPNACLSVVAIGTNTSQTTNIIKVVPGSLTPSSFKLFSPQGEACYYIATGY